MEYSDDDISWLTQEPSLNSQGHGLPIVDKYIEEEIPLDNVDNVISLEEGGLSRRVLYGNVIAEDISSDECIDQM